MIEAGSQELMIEYWDSQVSLVLDEESGTDSDDADDGSDADGSETDGDDVVDVDAVPGFGLVVGLLAALAGVILLTCRG